jgi:hypothetical protein
MGHGYKGKILNVDLSQGTFKEETIADDVYENIFPEQASRRISSMKEYP